MQIGNHPGLANIFRSLRFLRFIRGWDHVLRLFFDPDKQRPSDLAFDFAGKRYPGSTDNFVDWSAFFYGAYEQKWLDYCLKNIPLKDAPIVLDIGGNVGHHALYFAARGCQVHTFEPNPELWHRIDQKIALNHLEKSVFLHKVGLGARDETKLFHKPGGCNEGTGSFARVPDNWSGESVSLTVHAADSYLQQNRIDRADLVKIDVEEFEQDVMTGLEPFLKKCRPVLWLEISAKDPQRRLNIKAVRQYLDRDYRLFAAKSWNRLVTTPHFREISSISETDPVDIIAVPG